jgi:hypothetical protein
MDNQRQRSFEMPLAVLTIFLRTILTTASCTLFIVLVHTEVGPLAARVTSAFGGALLIWATIRWINRRADPRPAPTGGSMNSSQSKHLSVPQIFLSDPSV